MFDPKLLLDVLSRNVRKSGNPLGVDKGRINTWWREVEVTDSGEWLFFTGMMYQLMPYIESTVRYLERFESSRLQPLFKLSANLPVPFGILSRVTPEESVKEVAGILRGIHKLLVSSGTDVFYDPEIDTYSGVLLHDLGDENGFAEHALRVSKALESAGVEKIVTADPHTTYALKVLYPKYTGREFTVKSYIELIRPGKVERRESFVLHDPCYYGRYLEISDRIRDVLGEAGVEFTEPKYSGKLTNCCGGPIEAISPAISREIARLRLTELGDGRIITSCPICMANLRRAGGRTVDLAEVVS